MLQAMLTTLTALFLALAATSVDAQTGDAGSVVSLEGTVEIGRAGAFTIARVGSGIAAGDTIRTGTPGRARILFADESVLNVGDGSTLVIDETVYDPNQGAGSTLMHLLGGKVRALVSDYYSGGQGTYRIETTTAVSGVRGTEFVMAYDSGTQMTQVLGLGGEVAVHSTRDRRNNGVLIREMFITEVAKGRFPTPPRQITTEDEQYRLLMVGLDLPGSGLPESLLLEDPSFGGTQVPAPDTAEGVLVARPVSDGIGTSPNADLPPEEPGHAGGDLLDQPIPVLEAPTDVDVHF